MRLMLAGAYDNAPCLRGGGRATGAAPTARGWRSCATRSTEEGQNHSWGIRLKQGPFPETGGICPFLKK
ncbi:hypothetical protein GCM10010498_44470 [Streptomyces cavourensis]|nr:hypothetical protein GCM10010498_44470 [Streptomyces cavourensis]